MKPARHLLTGDSCPLHRIPAQPSPQTSKEVSLVLHTETSQISLLSLPPQSRDNQASQTLLDDPHFSGDLHPLNWPESSPSYQSMEPRAGSGSEGPVGVMGEPGFIKKATVRAEGEVGDAGKGAAKSSRPRKLLG